MTFVTSICEELNDANALIGKYEKALMTSPDDLSLLLNVKSLQKRCRRLEGRLLAATKTAGKDVCRYRLFTDDGKADIRSLTGALSYFQKLVSTVYNAIRNGPKQKARSSAEVNQETAFQFGYTFSGSVGFVLTLSNEQLMMDLKSNLDASFDAIFSMAKAPDSNAIGQYAQEFGHATIRSLQAWAKHHAVSGLGADITWKHARKSEISLLIQQQELRHLESAIEATSAETIESIILTGELYAADLKSKTFKMRFEDGEDVVGKFTDAISEAHNAVLPQRYKATLEKHTRVHYSMQENEIRYVLEGLELLN